ncbi:helix-turn-helix domain-containing protein (plasmid) [Nostoc sp. UHCC 0302]|uniref:helix-turn-helix domain-containing protein n=1 Tax=Nostoc sp. UHCC 0302 TaxID=3134896 RepID=UPI00311CB608
MGFRNGKPSKQFTAIPNSLIRDYNLTDSTFRLICWVASHDENFDISFTVIEKYLGYKRDKIRSAIKNAEENDYLVRVQENNPNNGKFDWQYYIFTSKEDTKFFRENHLSIGGSSIGGLPVDGSSIDGSSNGGSSIGGLSNVGSSTPHIEKQLEKKQLEEKHNREESPSISSDLIEVEDFSPTETQLQKLLQANPLPQPQEQEYQSPEFSFLPRNPESMTQNEDSAFGSKVLGLFDKSEQTNIISFPASTERSSRDLAKLQKYQQLDEKGITLKKPELVDWACLEIGQYVKTYRQSGCILTGGNDVSHEFAVYVASQNCKQRQEPTIALGFNVINKCEADPRCWQKLVIWVIEWQQARQTRQQVNVAAAVNHQQELERIRQAANTPFEL